MTTMTADDARRLVVHRYDRMVQSGEHEFYQTPADAIRAAAGQLVAELLVPRDMAEGAVRDATAFIARGGR
jgi:hypothetical protein